MYQPGSVSAGAKLMSEASRLQPLRLGYPSEYREAWGCRKRMDEVDPTERGHAERCQRYRIASYRFPTGSASRLLHAP